MGAEGVAAAAASEASPTAGAAAGVPSSPGTTRVYVGGLGGGVTAADVEKTFAPLGRVSRVEVVRTKGRALAFIDFQPQSDKSLAKLLATYNGCIWKGGRLRLEKAKEHYLDRLRREWAEDAESTSKPVIAEMSKDLSSSNKSRSMTEEKMQLRIFFPKLRKVKALPFKGTGKHKYSFQRIAVPSLPSHFCDCEEHYRSSDDPCQDRLNYLKDQTVMNEGELDIMNSVMSRLLEKGVNADVADGKAFSAANADILYHSYDETPSGDRDAALQTEADQDNLVTNIGFEDGDDVLKLMQLKGWDAASADQVSVAGKRQVFHDGLVFEKRHLQRRQITESRTTSEAPSSKRARLPSERNKSKERRHPSVAAGEMRHQQETESQQGNGFPTASQSPGSNCATEDPPEIRSKASQNLAMGQPGKGTSWLQKCSWKELVGDAGSSSTFTISHVLPGVVDSLRTRLPKSKGSANIRSDPVLAAKPPPESSYLKKPVETVLAAKPPPESSYLKKPVETRQNVSVKKKMGAPRRDEKSCQEDGDGQRRVGDGDADEAPRKHNGWEPTAATANISTSQVCTFMRSADSEREWTKAKAALSGQLKKKKNREGKLYEGTTTGTSSQMMRH